MEPVSFCAALFSALIVRAYEYKPGQMYVEHFNQDTLETYATFVYTDDYLQCWEDGLPARWRRCTLWWRNGITRNTAVSFNMDKQEQRQRIAEEIEDTLYAYHVYPHSGLVADFYVRYWDLAEAVCDYFDVPFRKPVVTKD